MAITKRAIILILPLTLAILTLGAIVQPATAQSQEKTYSFVGVTDEMFSGGVGVHTYNRACADSFASSRMCTSEELMQSVDPLVVGEDDLYWVRPVLQPTETVDADGEPTVLDASGALSGGTVTTGGDTLGGALSCHGWSFFDDTAEGLCVLLTSGGPGAGAFSACVCSELHRVACCERRDDDDD